MKRNSAFLSLPLLLASVFGVHSQPAPQNSTLRPPADTVILHGKLWTVDSSHPQAEALAILGDRIAAVGADSEISRWIGPNTKTIDAKHHTVLPGFIDAHVHFSSGGAEISGVQLRDAATPQEFAKRIAEFARHLPKGEWITGGTWDHELWGGSPLPSRDWIDSGTPDNPVFVERYDGHMGLANSLALKKAGITRDTPNPAGGAIVRDANGEPTGLLKDAAAGLVDNVIPDWTEEQRLRAIRAALAEARKYGVTGIDDISSTEDVRAYLTLLSRGELTTRVYCITPLPEWQNVAGSGLRSGFGNDFVRVGALKGFADGSLGSGTAWFYEPFSDQPGNFGLRNAMMEPEGRMLEMVKGADAAGLQIAVHAIGDHAIRYMLDVYDQVQKQNGARADRRWRIEHAQHMRPQDFDDFARLGVIASVQPYHAIDDGRWAEKRIGHERAKTIYAFRTFLDHGVRLAFGTDWTVAPLNPLLGLYAAVTRETTDGKNPNGWFPEQKLTLQEAIQAYTMGSAYAEFRENEVGSLTPGKFADVVILDSDVFSIPPDQIKSANAVTTILSGKTIFAR